MKPEPTDKPEPRDPMGKLWGESRTPAGPSAYGVVPQAESLAGKSSTDASLFRAQRTALAVKERFGDELLQILQFRDEWTVVTKPERLLEIMTFLRDTWNYRMCHDVTSVDLYPHEPRFMVVYHLLDLESATRFRVKCPVSGEDPEIDSVVPLWTGAEYTEREVFDLMGIRFKGHPDLRRILMPEDYQHFPLRKDFPLTGFPVGLDSLKD
jgi:NADH-quinone oxidoreductase subunit C